MTELMAWNADATRMPSRMHSQYLRQLFLGNELAEDRFTVAGKPVALTDIRVPIFAVGTVSDHVAPWRSTYKINFQTDTEVTYLLTTGGHNAGIVSEPGHAGRSFQVMTRKADDRYRDPETFLAQAPRKAGSWWPKWVAWLHARSGAPAAPPRPDRRSPLGIYAARRRTRDLCARRLISAFLTSSVAAFAGLRRTNGCSASAPRSALRIEGF